MIPLFRSRLITRSNSMYNARIAFLGSITYNIHTSTGYFKEQYCNYTNKNSQFDLKPVKDSTDESILSAASQELYDITLCVYQFTMKHPECKFKAKHSNNQVYDEVWDLVFKLLDLLVPNLIRYVIKSANTRTKKVMGIPPIDFSMGDGTKNRISNTYLPTFTITQKGKVKTQRIPHLSFRGPGEIGHSFEYYNKISSSGKSTGILDNNTYLNRHHSTPLALMSMHFPSNLIQIRSDIAFSNIHLATTLRDEQTMAMLCHICNNNDRKYQNNNCNSGNFIPFIATHILRKLERAFTTQL